MLNKTYGLQDFTDDSFLHGTIEKIFHGKHEKCFSITFSYLNLKYGGCLYECTITITDWLELQVIEQGKNVYKEYSINEIPIDIDQIIRYEYKENTLILKACGSLDIDAVIYYKFTKPKIQITGEYDPD